MAIWVSDRRIFVNADKSKVVEGDDPEAAYLLVGEGGTLDAAEAERLGLTKKAQAQAPESKQIDHPPENKSRRG